MNHLEELCCAACREKVEQIETRSRSGSHVDPIAYSVQAIEDRRELLAMLENLLLSVAMLRLEKRAMLDVVKDLMPTPEETALRSETFARLLKNARTPP